MSSPEPAVAAANLAFYEALGARNLMRMEKVWLHEASVTCVHPGWHRLDGWSEVRRSWETIFASSRPWGVACADAKVAVAGDLAWVVCVEVLTPFGGGPESAVRMQATNLFARNDGEWRMIHHHASPSRTEGLEDTEEPVN